MGMRDRVDPHPDAGATCAPWEASPCLAAVPASTAPNRRNWGASGSSRRSGGEARDVLGHILDVARREWLGGHGHAAVEVGAGLVLEGAHLLQEILVLLADRSGDVLLAREVGEVARPAMLGVRNLLARRGARRIRGAARCERRQRGIVGGQL